MFSITLGNLCWASEDLTQLIHQTLDFYHHLYHHLSSLEIAVIHVSDGQS